jgi:hypothetical protein
VWNVFAWIRYVAMEISGWGQQMQFDQSIRRDVVALVGWRGDRVAIRGARTATGVI